jgi:hypothetical protein
MTSMLLNAPCISELCLYKNEVSSVFRQRRGEKTYILEPKFLDFRRRCRRNWILWFGALLGFTVGSLLGCKWDPFGPCHRSRGWRRSGAAMGKRQAGDCRGYRLWTVLDQGSCSLQPTQATNPLHFGMPAFPRDDLGLCPPPGPAVMSLFIQSHLFGDYYVSYLLGSVI